jgi:D-psicose/D-tagatose/L-ribulose 3-epimerase
VHLDTYHMNLEEKGFYEPILPLGPRLKYIHRSESDRGTPGMGNIHWDEIFRGLNDACYDGTLVMESFAAFNEAIIGATALWRDVVGNPDALVTDGLVASPSFARKGPNTSCSSSLGKPHDVPRWIP